MIITDFKDTEKRAPLRLTQIVSSLVIGPPNVQSKKCHSSESPEMFDITNNTLKK